MHHVKTSVNYCHHRQLSFNLYLILFMKKVGNGTTEDSLQDNFEGSTLHFGVLCILVSFAFCMRKFSAASKIAQAILVIQFTLVKI